MLSSKLQWLAWRMQRVGQQKQSIYELRFVCGQHGSVTAPIGMSAEENAARNLLSKDADRIL